MFAVVADGRIRSVISFNRGGTWRQLNKPDNVDCGDVQNVRLREHRQTPWCVMSCHSLFVFSQQCHLHIHGEHSRNNRIIPMLPLSEPTAVGLVIAHGKVFIPNTSFCSTQQFLKHVCSSFRHRG